MKRGIAIAVLFAGIFIAAPAFGAPDGLAPGSLAPADNGIDAPVVDAPAVDAPAADAPPAVDSPSADYRCDNCPPPRKYDSQEVVKTRRDLHRTIKTIDTYEMAPAASAKQSGGIRVRSDVTLVNFVVHRYRVIYAPALVDASEVGERPAPAVYRPHGCKHGYNRHGSCRSRPVLRVRG
jgi:hypothetical protein